MEERWKQLGCLWDLQKGPGDFSMSIQVKPGSDEKSYKSSNSSWMVFVANILSLVVNNCDGGSFALDHTIFFGDC